MKKELENISKNDVDARMNRINSQIVFNRINARNEREEKGQIVIVDNFWLMK